MIRMDDNFKRHNLHIHRQKPNEAPVPAGHTLWHSLDNIFQRLFLKKINFGLLLACHDFNNLAVSAVNRLKMVKINDFVLLTGIKKGLLQ